MATVEDSGRPAPGAPWPGKTRRITALAAWARFRALARPGHGRASHGRAFSGTCGPIPRKPRPSRAARQSALKAIPVDKLDADARQKVSSVLSNVTLFRRMPVQVIQCDPDLYLFLVEHPDVVVNMWEVMGVTQLALQATGPRHVRPERRGRHPRAGRIPLLDHDTHLIYTEGSYHGPPFAKPVRDAA